MAFHGDLASSAGRRAAWIDSLVFDHSVLRLGWGNVAEVIPGKLYRSNHPTPMRLVRLVRRLGLRTLINVRGKRACGSDALSRDAAARLGLAHIDMAFESRGAPHRERILRFAEIYRTMVPPALLHCKSGADRAGLASALAIIFEGGSAADALGQLSLKYGHFSRSKTGVLDAFFHLYAREAEGRLAFLDWVRTEYDEVALRTGFRAHGLSSFINDRILVRE
jgi:protein tyrosine/serine phosphatase